MNDTRQYAPGESAQVVYALRALALILAAVVAESGRTVDEIAQIIRVRADRLSAGLDDLDRLPAVYLILLAQMADADVSTWWEDAQEGARIIAEQVRHGVACRRCGRAFPIGATSRPDGFGEHGQLFRCSGGFGCSVHPARRGPEFVDLVCVRCGGNAGRVRRPAPEIPVMCGGCSAAGVA